MKLLSWITSFEPKELTKLALLLGAIFAGCQVNRHEINEATAESDSNFVYIDEDLATMQETITTLTQRVAALEAKKPARRVVKRPAPKPRPGLFSRLWGSIPLIGG